MPWAPGQTFFGASEVLPSPALAMIDHMPAVQRDSGVYQVSGVTVRRTPYVPSEQTGGIGVDATDTGLLAAVEAERMRLLELAERDAAAVRAGSDEYARQVLEELEQRLSRLTASVQNGLRELQSAENTHTR